MPIRIRVSPIPTIDADAKTPPENASPLLVQNVFLKETAMNHVEILAVIGSGASTNTIPDAPHSVVFIPDSPGETTEEWRVQYGNKTLAILQHPDPECEDLRRPSTFRFFFCPPEEDVDSSQWLQATVECLPLQDYCRALILEVFDFLPFDGIYLSTDTIVTNVARQMLFYENCPPESTPDRFQTLLNEIYDRVEDSLDQLVQERVLVSIGPPRFNVFAKIATASFYEA